MNFFYISFSHAIIKRIFEFASIFPSYLIVYTVKTFWPSIVFYVKDQIILAPSRGILVDFWDPHDIVSCNFQNLLVFEYFETSQNLISFRQFFIFIISKGGPVKIWIPQKSAKMTPTWDQVDLVLWMHACTLYSCFIVKLNYFKKQQKLVLTFPYLR